MGCTELLLPELLLLELLLLELLLLELLFLELLLLLLLYHQVYLCPLTEKSIHAIIKHPQFALDPDTVIQGARRSFPSFVLLFPNSRQCCLSHWLSLHPSSIPLVTRFVTDPPPLAGPPNHYMTPGQLSTFVSPPSMLS